MVDLPTKHNLRKAGKELAFSGLMFSLLAASVKFASEHTDNVHTLVFFRNLFALLVYIPILLSSETSIKTDNFKFHLLRCGFGLTGMYLYFYAIANIPLGQASLLKFSGPIFVPLFGYFLLKEKITKGILGAVLVGFLGVFLVLGPELEANVLPSIAAITAALTGSIVVIILRRMSVSEPSLRTAFYFSLLATLVSSLPYSYFAEGLPDATAILYLLAAGFFASIGQIYLNKAYAHARAGALGPYTYLTVLFSCIWGWVIWGEVPPIVSAVGALLILSGIVIVNKDESKGVTVHRLGG